jgi:molybdopterin converting factor subunit 1
LRVKVRLFAILREKAGWREQELDLPPGASVGDAWHRLIGDVPALASTRDAVRFAVNRKYASADERLSDGDELALIPPVAGGSASNDLLRCELREEELEDELLAELRATVPTDADGALVIFVGQTRESAGTPAPTEEAEAAKHAGERVTGLDYEAFEEMALDVLRAIGAEIADRFGVHRLALIHRVGRVAVGEPSVVIAAAAAHRGAAFDAARYAIEELKARAPIWKLEHFADGSVWIGAPAREGPPSHRPSPEGEG